MSAPKKSFANCLGTDLIKLLRLYLAGERMSRTGKVYQKALGQIFSTFLRSVQAAPGEVCFFGTQKYRSSVYLLVKCIVMLLPIEYKPTSENALTLRDQGRQAVVGRGA